MQSRASLLEPRARGGSDRDRTGLELVDSQRTSLDVSGTVNKQPVDWTGIEPAFSGCKAEVLPLDDAARNRSAEER